MRRAVTLACAAALALSLAACGEKKDALSPSGQERTQVMLDFFPNADHAPLYAAQAGGHFKDLGLDVKIRQPADPSAPIKQVAAGRVDIAISYEPELLRARDQGLHVVSVGALVQRPLTSIISLPKAAVRKPSELAGKRVGTAGIDYQAAYLKTLLARAGVPRSRVQQKDVGFNLVPALLTHKVDAILGGYWNYEGQQLQLENKHPSILRIEQAGVPSYNELVLVANADGLDRNGPKIRRLIGALAQGTRDLQRDPGSALQGLLRANRDLDPALQRRSVQVTLPYFKPPEGKPYGYQDPAQWNAFAAWMRQNGILRRTSSARGAFTNRFLPGEGL